MTKSRWLSKVVAVSMDMNAQHDSVFREAVPHIQIIYDPFHIIMLYGDTVIKHNAYGLIADEYCFLKFMAASRRPCYKPRFPCYCLP